MAQVLDHSQSYAYSATARFLHWVIAAIVLGMIPVGLIIGKELGGPLQTMLYNLHRSLGILLIPLVLWRIAYRLTHKPVPLPAELPAIQRFAAETTQFLLYCLLLVQPFVGWIATSAYPAQFWFFGLFPVPLIWPENRDFSNTMFGVHYWIGLSMAALICAHVAGALYHLLIRKDGVFQRMTG
ncbi:MAG: cytochrome b [Pseudorhodoplanes sp.]